jgi:septal ring factor EnvC (AmiA/AmiB activator)
MKLFACTAVGATASLRASEGELANPIRRVVTLLQSMQAKIEAEGEQQDKNFAKFQCYCETNAAKLSDSVDQAKSKIESLSTDIESSSQDRAQTVADLASAKESRESAQKAIADATAQRQAEAKAFEETSTEFKTNIAAMEKAIPAIENGMGGSFLQTNGAGLAQLVSNSKAISDEDRSTVEAFLQAASGASVSYAPQSGEIVGILKQMNDTMKKDLADATATEDSAIADFNELVAAQNKAIQAATDSIEEKTQQSGELAVAIVELKNEKADTEQQLTADTGFADQLEKDCAKQTKEYAEIKQTRADEVLAIADTIKILNDDDVLDLFKKTLPSLLEIQVSQREIAAKALKLVLSTAHKGAHPRLDLIALALRGKTMGFDGVVKMIDGMEGALKKEQKDDESKKAYCEKEFHETELRFKELGHEKDHLDQQHQNLDAAIKETEETIVALGESIKDLDKAVAEATEIRKTDHDDYVSSTAQDQAAVQIMEFAKNRLQKFYNPKMYKAKPKRVLTDEERLYASAGGDIGTTPPPGELANTGISAGFVQISQDAQDAPPEAPKVGGYEKQQGGGVLGMIDRLINDLKTEMNEHRLEEEDAQEDYEKLMKDSAEKRAADSKAVSENESVLAEAKSDLSQNHKDRKANAKNTGETHSYKQDLEKSCNFLLENFDARKQARTEEGESLDKGKVVLSGADVEFVQVHRVERFLAK